MAGVGFLTRIELCQKCGESIIKFLKKYKFITPQKRLGKLKIR